MATAAKLTLLGMEARANAVRGLTKGVFEEASKAFAKNPSSEAFRRLERFARIHQHATHNMATAELSAVTEEGDEVGVLLRLERLQRAMHLQVYPEQVQMDGSALTNDLDILGLRLLPPA